MPARVNTATGSGEKLPPRLDMRKHHIALIVSGQKTTTLRPTRLRRGPRTLYIENLPEATVEIECQGPVMWPALSDDEKAALANSEGYTTVERFEDACKGFCSRGRYWLRGWLYGEKPMYLHKLSNPKTLEER